MAVTRQQDSWVSRVLGVAPDGLVDWTVPVDRRRWAAVKSIWSRASDSADKQIDGLVAVLRGSEDPELQQIADMGLHAVTGNFKVPLLAALADIDASPEAPPSAAVAKLRQVISGFMDHLAGDSRVAAVDDNGLGARVNLAGTLIPALEELDIALAQWA